MSIACACTGETDGNKQFPVGRGLTPRQAGRKGPPYVMRRPTELKGTGMYTRREFGALVAGSIPVVAALYEREASAQAAFPPNRSLINGVQFGLQPFCYHDLPMTPGNRGTLIKRL